LTVHETPISLTIRYFLNNGTFVVYHSHRFIQPVVKYRVNWV
ncbi:MAG: hypothetical protein AMDU1_APLC00025G0005, partial [Thermoplasmatales archaeon A-plasma]